MRDTLERDPVLSVWVRLRARPPSPYAPESGVLLRDRLRVRSGWEGALTAARRRVARVLAQGEVAQLALQAPVRVVAADGVTDGVRPGQLDAAAVHNVLLQHDGGSQPRSQGSSLSCDGLGQPPRWSV